MSPPNANWFVDKYSDKSVLLQRGVFDNYFSSNTSEVNIHVPTIGRLQMLITPSTLLDKHVLVSI